MANSTLQFWLSYNNGAERLRLPVNPETISVSSTHGYEEIEVAGLGEFTVIGNAKLRDFSFSSFFPRDYNASYCEYESIPDPWNAVATVERWKASKRPIRLTITGTPINVAVTVRTFTYSEQAGHVGDVYFDISLKEYVFIESTSLNQTNASDGSVQYVADTQRPSNSVVASPYTVASGDSLWKIAQKAYGDGDKWRVLYNANKAVVGANPNVLKSGQKLVIPS